MREIVDNPEGVDAVNISIAFRSPYCHRQSGYIESLSCFDQSAIDVIDDLYDLGIPVITALFNEDIESGEKTFPACIDKVIKVGADNDNINFPGGGGIGIGANGIDFYANNSIPENGGSIGNSMAAPRVAAAYAILRDAVPGSTIQARTEALIETATSTNTYKGGNTRSVIKKTNIQAAIDLLEILSTGVLEVLAISDNNQYGSFYGDSSSDYSFEINFDAVIAQTKSSKSESSTRKLSEKTSSLSRVRDVVLEFDASEVSNQSQSYAIYINNSLYKNGIQVSGTEDGKKFTISRDEFDSGSNTVRIVPFYSSRPWGITNIKAEFTPVVELIFGEVDPNMYGSDEAEERPTGMRASFELNDTNSDVSFAITGWDIDTSDEIAIFFNGVEQGFLTQSSNLSFNSGDLFLFKKEDLQEGSNVIELVHKVGVATPQWGVKDLLVVLNNGPGSISLGTPDTTQYGNNYGTNENPLLVDFTFTAETQHDHQLSWQAFDVDQPGDLDVYLNGTKIKAARTTGNNAHGTTEIVTVAWRLFNTGSNTLSFRSKVGATDDTWGVRNVLVKTSDVINLDSPASFNTDFGYYTQYAEEVPIGWTRLYSLEDYQTRLYATFGSDGLLDKSITFRGWDIDSTDEMGIYLNGVFQGYVTSAGASSIYSDSQTVRFTAAELINGTNTLSFRTKDGAFPGFQDEKWGLIFDSERDIDPEAGKRLVPVIMMVLDEDTPPP
jgi:hypothetical protein